MGRFWPTAQNDRTSPRGPAQERPFKPKSTERLAFGFLQRDLRDGKARDSTHCRRTGPMAAQSGLGESLLWDDGHQKTPTGLVARVGGGPSIVWWRRGFLGRVRRQAGSGRGPQPRQGRDELSLPGPATGEMPGDLAGPAPEMGYIQSRPRQWRPASNKGWAASPRQVWPRSDFAGSCAGGR